MQFLLERIEMAKYSSDDQVAIFASLLHKSLDIHVGKQTPLMSRSVAALGPRFRLVFVLSRISLHLFSPYTWLWVVVYRENYSAALDCLTIAPQHPVEKHPQFIMFLCVHFKFISHTCVTQLKHSKDYFKTNRFLFLLQVAHYGPDPHPG